MRFFVDGSIKTPITEYLTNPKYQQVEYLESTGTQYIDTGIKSTDLTAFDMFFIPSENTQSYQVYLSSETNGTFTFGESNSDITSVYLRYGGNKTLFARGLISSTNQNRAYINNNKEFIVNETNCDSITSDVLGTVDENVYIGHSSITNRDGKFKTYRLKLYTNVLVRNFIPAIRKEDGKPGMYDKVSGQFFTNAGTGEFLYGNHVYNGVPKGYKECEYLESTGTQYIDTGFTCISSDNYSIIENVEWISWANGFSNNWNAVEGETGMTQQLFFGPKGKNTTNQFYYGLENGGVTYTESTYTGLNERHVYELTRSEGKSIIKKDGVELYNGIKTGPIIKYYRLFGCILYENDASYSYNFMRNYGTKVIKNGSLFRDYVPALREADNEPGMYDRVSNTFFANKGTGTFIYKLKERQTEKVTRILYSGSKMRLVRNPTA